MKDIYEIVDEYFGELSPTGDYEKDKERVMNVADLGDFIIHYVHILGKLTKYKNYGEATPRSALGRHAKEICLDIIDAIDSEVATDLVAEYMAERGQWWEL